jgi:hypothetical protein
VFIIQIGALKVKDLLDVATAEVLIRFVLKEVEMAWRVKFAESQQYEYKPGVD